MKEIEITTSVIPDIEISSLLEEIIPDIEISSPTQGIEEFILQVEEQKQVEITVK